mmetsp:Transcript_8662/g.25974  ORF Transcript_8662/g.25974 Transcript_8662/m.25974 type:complete len:80 (+) Transcript_8662:322-561(+)|eukprot:CAMPEP_0113583328 /NCGR_PEP_ID=MMETSP0015_2-20120614/32452_1 /TAXON_ID=2838 /ORGANISM="Odontella" /LENGTH=79 /DNA_ID=CAMNT_0000488185 /DNA_START=198 /DNA_END=437 /DNA_ORIENTATION=+ /assembly_acc=CAM_ASM_000160
MYPLHAMPSIGTAGTNGHANVSGGRDLGRENRIAAEDAVEIRNAAVYIARQPLENATELITAPTVNVRVSHSGFDPLSL